MSRPSRKAPHERMTLCVGRCHCQIIFLEIGELGTYCGDFLELMMQCAQRLQPIASDRKYDRLLRVQATLADQLPGNGHRHTPRGLSKDAFRFGQQANSLDDFLIRSVLSGAAATEAQ